MINLDHVTKAYKGTTVALRDVSVDIQKGEFVFLVGPSGSGKSTFLRLVTKEELADHGRVWVAGKEVGALSSFKVPYLRRNIGCVFQDFRLLPTKTVYENVAFALEVIGRPRHVVRSQVPQILDLVGLSKKLRNLPHELSGGEQQRVAIARAIINEPKIVLADEPTGNLDTENSENVLEMLRRLNRELGQTIVMITHNQEATVYAHRVVHMRDGLIVDSLAAD
jgi:cell division transport system ATP-binding protein